MIIPYYYPNFMYREPIPFDKAWLRLFLQFFCNFFLFLCFMHSSSLVSRKFTASRDSIQIERFLSEMLICSRIQVVSFAFDQFSSKRILHFRPHTIVEMLMVAVTNSQITFKLVVLYYYYYIQKKYPIQNIDRQASRLKLYQ